MKLGEALVKLGYVSEDDITETLSAQFGVPSINLSHFEIDPNVLKLVAPEVARKYNILPVNKTGRDDHDRDGGPDERVRHGRHQVHDGLQRRARRRLRDRAPAGDRPPLRRDARPRAQEGHGGDVGRRHGRHLARGRRGVRAGDDRPREARRRGRGSPRHPAREHHPDGRDQAQRVRHPHRAVRARVPRALPHRRHPLRGHEPASEAQGGDRLAHQDPREARHRREAAPAGRAHQDQDEARGQGQGARLPRLRAPDALRREDRLPPSRQGQPHARHDEAGVREGLPASLREGDPPSVGHGPRDRARPGRARRTRSTRRSRASTRPRRTS